MRKSLLLLVLAATSVCVLGCAALGKREPVIDDVAPEREARKQAAVQRFERKRAAAEISAARMRFQQGDLATSLSILERVLQRIPDHREAKLLSAEVQLATGNADEAGRTLQSILRDDADDAPAHHNLAMVLESRGELAAALSHARRAVELEPSNSLYTVTLEEIERAAGRAELTAESPASSERSGDRQPQPSR